MEAKREEGTKAAVGPGGFKLLDEAVSRGEEKKGAEAGIDMSLFEPILFQSASMMKTSVGMARDQPEKAALMQYDELHADPLNLN